MTLGGAPAAGLLDSGNVWRSAISQRFFRSLGSQARLRPIKEKTVGTAGEGSTLKVLGELEDSLPLEVAQLPGGPFRMRPVVIQGLAMDLNISGPWMKAHAWDQIHSQGAVRIRGHLVYLLEEATAAPVVARVAQDQTVPARSMTVISLKPERPFSGPTDALLEGSVRFMETTDLHPTLGAMVRVQEGNGLFAAGIINTLDQEVQLKAGTAYGTLQATEEESPGLFAIRGPITKRQKKQNFIDQFLKNERAKAEAHRKGDQPKEQQPSDDWTTAQKKAWLDKHFQLGTKPCFQGKPERVQQALDLLLQYWSFFSFDGSFGETDLVTHRIITEDVPPIKDKYRPVNPALEPDLKRQLDKWLKHDVIEPAESPWSANMVAAAKKNGKVRWCVDWRSLNRVTKRDSYPMPNVTDNMTRLAGSTIFSTFDMEGAFHVIKLNRRDREKTAFATPFGQYQQKRLGFGLTNGPSAYCRLVEKILKDIPPLVAIGFLDDGVVHSSDFPTHLRNLKRTLDAYRAAGLRLSVSKCHFFEADITYLGHQINAEGIRPTDDHVKSITKWPLPRYKTEARGFLGAAGYYQNHIRDYARLASPWFAVIGKTTPEDEKKPLTITPAMEDSFEQLKKALTSKPVLGFPYFQGPRAGRFTLDTDFSNDQIAGILSQEQHGREVVIAYGSKKLSKSQQNYPSTKGELWAGIFFMEKYKYYLLFRRFRWRTDNKALKAVRTMKVPQSTVLRWLSTLADFDFEVEHREGKKHTNADALSRHAPADDPDEPPDEQPRIDHLASVQGLPASEDFNKKEEQDKDDVLVQVKLWVERGYPPDTMTTRALSSRARFYAAALPRLEVDDGVLYYQQPGISGLPSRKLYVLPQDLLDGALDHAHVMGGHAGIGSTTERLLRSAHYPGVKKEVAIHVANCPECQARKKKEPDQRHTLIPSLASYPFAKIHVDFVGPLPEGTLTKAKYLLTVRDAFSRWTEAIPLKRATAEDTAKALEREVFTRFGYPEHIHSDCGRQFTSNLFRTMCDELNIRCTTTPAYNPKSNGMVERSHRDLGAMLKALTRQHNCSWEEVLPQALFAMRTAVCRSTGLAPYQILFGRDVSTPLEALFGNPNPLPPTDSTAGEYAARLRKRLRITQEYVRKNIGKAVARQRRTYNKDKKLFHPGAKVWLFTPVSETTKKLASFYTGPWIVCASPDNTDLYVRIAPDPLWKPQLPSQVVSIDRLKAFQSKDHRPPQATMTTNEIERHDDDGVEFILTGQAAAADQDDNDDDNNDDPSLQPLPDTFSGTGSNSGSGDYDSAVSNQPMSRDISFGSFDEEEANRLLSGQPGSSPPPPGTPTATSTPATTRQPPWKHKTRKQLQEEAAAAATAAAAEKTSTPTMVATPDNPSSGSKRQQQQTTPASAKAPKRPSRPKKKPKWHDDFEMSKDEY